MTDTTQETIDKLRLKGMGYAGATDDVYRMLLRLEAVNKVVRLYYEGHNLCTCQQCPIHDVEPTPAPAPEPIASSTRIECYCSPCLTVRDWIGP